MPVILDNPIISNYVQGLQMRRQQEQTEFEREQKKEESGRAQEQLKGYLAHLKAEEAHQSATLDIEKQRVAGEAASHRLQATKFLQENIASGGIRPGQGPAPVNPQTTMGIQQSAAPQSPGQPDLNNLPTTQQNVVPQGITAQPGTPSQPVDIGGGVMINPDDFAGPSAMLQSHLNALKQTGAVDAQNAGLKAGAEAGATNTANEPFQISSEQRRATTAAGVASKENEYKLGQISAEGRNRLAETALRNSGGITEASIHAKATMDSARIKMFGGVDSPTEWNNIVAPYRYGEAAKPLGNTPRDSIVRQHIGDAIPGAVEVTPAMATTLKNNIGLNNIYKEMETIIDKLPSSKVNAFGQHLIAKVDGTDAKNVQDQLQGMYLDALKSKNEFAARAVKTEMGAISGLLGGGPGKTKEQAKANLTLGRRLSSNQLLDSTLSNAPEAQKLDTLLHYHIDPTIYTSKGADGKAYPRYSQDPTDKTWGIFNPKTLHYDPIEK